MIKENYKKIKDLPGGKFGLFENTETKKQKTLPLSMADKNGNASVQKNKEWTYNDEIPETPVAGVKVQQEIKADTYDLLKATLAKLREHGKHVDNCGNCAFECKPLCESCQSSSLRSRNCSYYDCRRHTQTQHRNCTCESCQRCEGCQTCQLESCQKCQSECKELKFTLVKSHHWPF